MNIKLGPICVDCRMEIRTEQEYWILKRKNKLFMSYCDGCWNDYSFEKIKNN